FHEPVGAVGNKPTPDPSREGTWSRSSAPLLGGAGGGFMVPMHFKKKWGLSMNRTNSVCMLPSKAAEGRRTPRRWRVGQGQANLRQVLECAAPAALWNFP